MDLKKLFETQKVLRDRINYNEPDRFDKLVLALLVEVGECANEWRGFKFWSSRQKANELIFVDCPNCKGTGFNDCSKCDGDSMVATNPLLEEYVDILHFVLEAGLEHEFDKEVDGLDISPIQDFDITSQFTALMRADWNQYQRGDGGYYHEGLELFIGLGEMLGFTWEQIEAAYYEKNKINHDRQESGY